MTDWFKVWLTVILVSFGVLTARVIVLEKENETSKQTTYVEYESPTSKPTEYSKKQNPQVAGEKFNPTPTTDPNPYINCRISEKCGGGTRYIRQDECNNITCCLIESGNKVLTKHECDNYYIDNPKEREDTNYYGTNFYDYEPPPTYPPCEIYYAILGYSMTYYIDTNTCNQWKTEQDVRNQEYLNQLESYSYDTYYYEEQEPVDYTSYCSRELEERKRSAQALFGTSISTYDGIVQIYETDCYPECFSTGTWPSDCYPH